MANGENAAGAFRLDVDGEWGVLHFDLPGEKVNKLSSSVMKELEGRIEELEQRSDLRYLIIVSDKPKIFIAGADISEFRNVPNATEAEKYTLWGQSVFTRLSKLPQVTVAVIHGACMGGGTELALNCDYRLLTDSEKSQIATPEVKLGIIPAWTGTTRLPRLLGLPAALDMILTGRSMRGRGAKKIGLVDDLVPEAIPVQAARRFLEGRSKRSIDTGSRVYLERNALARNFVLRKARQSVEKKTGGHYPAPFRAIDVIDIGFREGLEAGYRAEAKAAAELIMGKVAPNLVRLFFMMEDAKKSLEAPARPVEYVGVLGAGLMGGGIAQTLADRAGIPVRMKDINWEALAGGMQSAAKVLEKQVERRRMSKAEMRLKLAKITTTTDWSGFGGVDVVIEAVVEKLEIKQQVLREFEEIGGRDGIFATNTSTIPITRIAEAAARPENVIGMHFFSPVEKMPLVEVILGEKTSRETASTIVELARRMGKTVVVCKDGPGFIVNRILAPYMNEAGYLVEEGKTIDSIDDSMERFGMPLGPLALLDEVGIDVAGKAAQVLADAFGDRMPSSSLVDTLIGDERYGKKNSRGVYRWEKRKRTTPDPDVYALLGVQDPQPGNPREMSERMLLAMINEAALVLEEGIAASAADIDLAMIMGTGFPPFRGGLLRYADSLGLSYVNARLQDLATTVGPRFEPSEPLARLGENDGSFYAQWPSDRPA